jgi:hypothetical protein
MFLPDHNRSSLCIIRSRFILPDMWSDYHFIRLLGVPNFSNFKSVAEAIRWKGSKTRANYVTVPSQEMESVLLGLSYARVMFYLLW